MSTILEAGHRINLEKSSPGLKRVRVGLGWKVNATEGEEFDLDLSVFLCSKNANGDPVMLSNAHIVFYNQLNSPDGAVVHSGTTAPGIRMAMTRSSPSTWPRFRRRSWSCQSW